MIELVRTANNAIRKRKLNHATLVYAFKSQECVALYIKASCLMSEYHNNVQLNVKSTT